MMAVAKIKHSIGCHTTDVTSVAFTNGVLATASADKSVRMWNMTDWGEMPGSPLIGHTYVVHCCAFSPTGDILASASTDGWCILWDIHAGSKLGVLMHRSKAAIRICQFSANGERLATGGDDEQVYMWDVASRTVIRCYEGHEASIMALAFSPGGFFLASTSTNGDIRLWDSAYGHGRHLHHEINGHDLGVTCCGFSPTYGSAENANNKSTCQVHFLFASGGNDNLVKLWDILAYTGSSDVQVVLRCQLVGHAAAVMACAFSPDGKLMASGSGDKSVRLWDPLKGTIIDVIQGHTRYITCCAFSRDGKYLATGSNDKQVKIWTINQRTPQTDTMDNDDVFSDTQTPAESVVTNSVQEWTVDEVCSWLTTEGMGQYAQIFCSQAIDGRELLTLTPNTLQHDLAIEALGHRNKLVRAIRSLTVCDFSNRGSTSSKDAMGPDDHVPDEYLCPITRDPMHDPVIAADGYTYERSAMVAWMAAGHKNSPMTNAPLTSPKLTPNRCLKMLIQRTGSQS